MSDNPTDPQASEAGPDTNDGEGFGGPGADVERAGPAGAAPGPAERDPDDDAGMVSG